MVETRAKTITFAHSPDPDDAYMFYGFETGKVGIPGYEIKHHLEDIQTLNERAFRGEFEITAVSAHAFAYLSEKYWALSCGASVGRNYGPMLVVPSDRKTADDPRRIAIPGKWTTAALVLELWLKEKGIRAETIVVPFDQILPAVLRGEIESGLIIHEGQLTYGRDGAQKIWDAGEWWTAQTKLPLPLGLDIVRKDLGKALASQISNALRASISYANDHREAAIEYALGFGRGLDKALAKQFVGMYVNEDTLEQGKEVQEGLKVLYAKAYEKGIIPKKPDIQFV